MKGRWASGERAGGLSAYFRKDLLNLLDEFGVIHSYFPYVPLMEEGVYMKVALVV